MTLEIDFRFECSSWAVECKPLAENAVRAALEHAPMDFTDGEVSVVFADDNFVQRLNKEYRGKDSPTNVLSFPQIEKDTLLNAPEFVTLGDIVLAHETIEGEAKNQSKTLEDHLVHLIVHGTLHLLGYDHEDEQEAQEMEALEILILESLHIKNPYESIAFMA